MALKFKKLNGSESEPFTIEIQGYWPEATMLLIHIERLPFVKVLSKASFVMTDDVRIDFTYKDFPFSISSPFSYLWVSACSPNVPEPIFEELVNHIKNYKTVWPHQLIAGIFRHLKLPKWK